MRQFNEGYAMEAIHSKRSFTVTIQFLPNIANQLSMPPSFTIVKEGDSFLHLFCSFGLLEFEEFSQGYGFMSHSGLRCSVNEVEIKAQE